MIKKIILKAIILENFKGQNMHFEFSNGRVIIKGKNKAGKSTLTNAFFWLLMGVDSEDQSNYDLFDSSLEFSHENAVPAVVEGVFDIDGVEYTFKRQAKQKWVRKRSKAEYEKAQSDEYTFYVDGLAVSSKVYKERIETLIAPISKLKLMLNVRYYQMLEWKELRKHFADMVGAVNENELQGDYSAIKPLIEKYKTVEAVKEYLKQNITPLRKTMAGVAAKVEAMRRLLPSLEGVEEAESQRDKLILRIAEIDKEILGLGDANKPYIEKREAEQRAIAKRQRELLNAKDEWWKKEDEKLAPIRKKLSDLKQENEKIQKRNIELTNLKRNLEADIERTEKTKAIISENVEKLRDKKNALKAQFFDENQVCQSCGQPLPADKIAVIRAEFNDRKQKSLDEIIAQGKQMAAERDCLENAISEKKSQLSAIPALQPVLDSESLEVQLADMELKRIPFEKTEEYAALTAEIEDMRKNLTVVPEVDANELMEEKQRLNDELVDVLIICGNRQTYEDGESKIAVVEQEGNKASVEEAKLGGLLEKCIEREREWASIVSDKANKYLEYSRVEMTEFTKAGEIIDACKLTERNKVSSKSTNNASQILIGIDVANAFQRNAGVNLPIFIDNCEGIDANNTPKVDNQLILLYVDADYKKLTIV